MCVYVMQMTPVLAGEGPRRTAGFLEGAYSQGWEGRKTRGSPRPILEKGRKIRTMNVYTWPRSLPWPLHGAAKALVPGSSCRLALPAGAK